MQRVSFGLEIVSLESVMGIILTQSLFEAHEIQLNTKPLDAHMFELSHSALLTSNGAYKRETCDLSVQKSELPVVEAKRLLYIKRLACSCHSMRTVSDLFSPG